MGTVYSLYKADHPESYELGKGEWFPICKDRNFVIFKMNDLWSLEALTKFVRKALSVQGGITVREARATAQHILDWCGDERIVMIPDSFDEREEMKTLGIKMRKRHQEVGSRWDIYTAASGPLEMNAREKAESDKLAQQVWKEQNDMMMDAVGHALVAKAKQTFGLK